MIRGKLIALILPVALLAGVRAPVVNQDPPQLEALDHAVDSFMTAWNLKGTSLAIVRNDSLVYAKGYGVADEKTPMTPGTTMRLASVSKLLTAVGIMKLQEDGKLLLESPVFGPDGVLRKYNSCIKDSNYYKITIEHLLRHQGGFTTRYGDVMFSHTKYETTEALVRGELAKPLYFVPGDTQDYSNFGYLLLSLIIEEVSGMPYAHFMQERVFAPAGCSEFRIGGNYLTDRIPGETRYFVQPGTGKITSFDGKYDSVEKCYGGNNVTGLMGAGAWVGSAVELARLVSCIDGHGPMEDILSPESIRQMTAWFDEDTSAIGWAECKPQGEWTRTGSFSGTSNLIKVYPDGECWVLMSNTSTSRASWFTKNTALLFKDLRRRFSGMLPSRDLFKAEEITD